MSRLDDIAADDGAAAAIAFQCASKPSSAMRSNSSLRATDISTASGDSGESNSANAFEPMCFGEWVYWQRDSEREPECWTKVFAVVEEDTSIGLYGCEDLSPRTLVHRCSMWSVHVEMSRRRIKILDAQGVVVMRLWLLSHANHAIWKLCLDRAVLTARAPAPSRVLSLSRRRATPSTSKSSTSAATTSSTSIQSIGELCVTARASNVSKRSAVKAACKATLAEMKRRVQAITERK